MDVVGCAPGLASGAPRGELHAAAKKRCLVFVTQRRRRPGPVLLIVKCGREQPVACEDPANGTGMLGCLHGTTVRVPTGDVAQLWPRPLRDQRLCQRPWPQDRSTSHRDDDLALYVTVG